MVKVVDSSNIVLERVAYTLSCEATGDPMLQANIQYHSRVLKYYMCLTRVQLLREKIYSHSQDKSDLYS